MDIQNTFKALLHRQIEIEKLSLKGKLTNLLFSTDNNGFSIELNLIVDEKNKAIRIPAPFRIENHPEDGLLYLDYRLTTIFHESRWKPILKDVNNIYTKNEFVSKFFNDIVEISYS